MSNFEIQQINENDRINEERKKEKLQRKLVKLRYELNGWNRFRKH